MDASGVVITQPTATPGADFTSVTSFAIPDGASQTVITFPIINDNLIEVDEAITVEISSPSSGGVNAAANIANAFITDNDSSDARFSIAAKSQGFEDGADASFVVSLDGGLSNHTGADVTISLAFAGTSVGTDFTGVLPTQAVIADGESEVTISIPVMDDLLIEGNETLVAIISGPSLGAVSANSSATTDIIDNELNNLILSLANAVNGAENPNAPVSFELLLLSPSGDNLTNSTGAPITVDVEFATGSTAVQADFSSSFPSQLSVADGQTQVVLSLNVQDDMDVESIETLQANISNPSAGVVSANAIVMTIEDDDAVIDITAPAVVQEVDNLGTLTFSSNNGNRISLTDTATDDIDLTLSVLNGTLTIPLSSGVTFQSGTSNGANSIIFRGTLAQINQALEGLVYDPNNSTAGSDTLTISAQSILGHNASETVRFSIRAIGVGNFLRSQVTVNTDPAKTILPPLQIQNPDNSIIITPVKNLIRNTGTSFDLDLEFVNRQDGSARSTNVEVLVTYTDGSTEVILVPVTVYYPLLEIPQQLSSLEQFNYSTGFFEQIVKVSNPHPYDMDNYRIEVSNIPSSLTLKTFTSENGGVYRIEPEGNIPANGGERIIILEYRSSTYVIDSIPTLELRTLENANTGPTITNFEVVAVEILESNIKNHFFLLFETEVGSSYFVRYRDGDSTSWKTSPIEIDGTGFKVVWEDNGPPRTSVPSFQVDSRFYQVIKKLP